VTPQCCHFYCSSAKQSAMRRFTNGMHLEACSKCHESMRACTMQLECMVCRQNPYRVQGNNNDWASNMCRGVPYILLNCEAVPSTSPTAKLSSACSSCRLFCSSKQWQEGSHSKMHLLPPHKKQLL
jgi:hypothetical protein